MPHHLNGKGVSGGRYWDTGRPSDGKIQKLLERERSGMLPRVNRSDRIRRIPQAARLAGLGPALAALAGFAVVPTSLPLCTTAMDECGLVATMVAAPGARCTMDEAGLGGMPCCIEDAAPGDPQPAPPGKADPGHRAQPEAQAPVPAGGDALLAACSPAALGLAPEPKPALPSVPLYTLLSVLLT